MSLSSINFLAASDSFFGELGLVVLGIALLLAVGLVVLIIRCWHKVSQGFCLWLRTVWAAQKSVSRAWLSSRPA